MEKYMITGMSCAACQARVEKAVNSVDGVSSCNVNLLTNSMGVEGSASKEDIIKAVEEAGYGASLMDAEEEALKDTQTPVLKKRLITSLAFLIVLMYISMGHHMFGFPLPMFLAHNHIAMGITQMILSLVKVLPK